MRVLRGDTGLFVGGISVCTSLKFPACELHGTSNSLCGISSPLRETHAFALIPTYSELVGSLYGSRTMAHYTR